MRILIDGAGVLGSELAHVLINGGNDVTILARGHWKEVLEQKGLVIRHSVQLVTTRDQVKVIEKLADDDIYDLIFVVMQFSQLQEALPLLANNGSKHVIVVGNNLTPETAQRILITGNDLREVAFAFLAAAGRREEEKVVSFHAVLRLAIGSLDGMLSRELKSKILSAFQLVKIRLVFEPHMDAWLKCHMAFILPIAYVCYAVNCRLPGASKQQLAMIIDATKEAHAMLKKLGYPIRPDGEEEFFAGGRIKAFLFLWIMAKTPLGRLVASDHCRNAVQEMSELDEAFENLRKQAGVPMPVWDQLRKQGRPGLYMRKAKK